MRHLSLKRDDGGGPGSTHWRGELGLARSLPSDLQAVLRGAVCGIHPCALAVQLVTQRALGVARGVDAAALQLRDDERHDVLEGRRRDGVGEVEAIDVCLLDPCLQLVGDLLGRADDARPEATDLAVLGDVADGPLGAGIRLVLERRDE